MFSQVSVCPGGCLPHYMLGYTPPAGHLSPLGRHTPLADTPLGRHYPWADTPLPSACWDTHNPLPSACWDTPFCTVHAGIRSVRAVRIPLECILVKIRIFEFPLRSMSEIKYILFLLSVLTMISDVDNKM